MKNGKGAEPLVPCMALILQSRGNNNADFKAAVCKYNKSSDIE